MLTSLVMHRADDRDRHSPAGRQRSRICCPPTPRPLNVAPAAELQRHASLRHDGRQLNRRAAAVQAGMLTGVITLPVPPIVTLLPQINVPLTVRLLPVVSEPLLK